MRGFGPRDEGSIPSGPIAFVNPNTRFARIEGSIPSGTIGERDIASQVRKAFLNCDRRGSLLRYLFFFRQFLRGRGRFRGLGHNQNLCQLSCSGTQSHALLENIFPMSSDLVHAEKLCRLSRRFPDL